MRTETGLDVKDFTTRQQSSIQGSLFFAVMEDSFGLVPVFCSKRRDVVSRDRLVFVCLLRSRSDPSLSLRLCCGQKCAGTT